MTAQQLKNSILQMAVQGKLVPQDPNDEPASMLIERIRAEKEKLIKEKKIKREKNPSVIFRGADNIPYEKIGDEVRELSVPYDIPASWEWVRFSAIAELQSGQDLTPDKYNASEKGIPYITGASNIENGQVIVNRWTENGRAFAYQGNLLLTCKGTVGTMAILDIVQVHIARQIMAIQPYQGIVLRYLQIVLETLVADLKAAAKSMIPGIAREDVLTSIIPIPPYAEQLRIVEKYESLQPWVDRYEKSAGCLQNLNSTFPELLRKSILQMAVQGKLVPQDENDEPAEVLLDRIRAEKEALIKAGKIKRDKHESVIFRRDNSHYEKRGSDEICIDNELPFTIPSTWAWCRISTIGNIVRGSGIKRTETTESGLPCVRYGEIYTSYNISFEETKSFISPTLDKQCKHFAHGDIVFTLTGENKPDIAKAVAYMGNTPVAAGGDLAYWEHHGMNPLYLVFLMASPYVINCKVELATGDIIVHISGDKIGSILVPIPPLKEQERIVARILEMFQLCKDF